MTEFKQIADNPNLVGWFHRETKIDHQYKTVVIEETPHWGYVYIPGLEKSQGEHKDAIDYNRIPQSLHFDGGMKITWGWMKFQVGYRQSINVQAGQRYTAVAKFEGDIHETQDPNAIQWMFFADGLQSTHSEWSAYMNAGQFGLAAEHQFVFQTAASGWVDLTFWTKAEWPDSAGEIRIKSIEVFEVPTDYGEALPITPFPNDEQHPPGPSPDPPDLPEPEPDTPEAPIWMLPLFVGVIGALLGVILYSFIQPHIQYVAMEGNPVEELLNQLFAIPAIAPIAFSGAIILYLVEVGKRLKTNYIPDILPWLTPEFMVVFWVVFFMAAFGIAQQYQYDNLFKQIAEVVTQLVNVLGPYVLGMIGTQVAVAVAHKGIRKVNVSGFDQ